MHHSACVITPECETIFAGERLTDLEDFAELVEHHQTLVFRTLARLTGQREGLEDLAQEVFLRLFRALPQFRGQARITTFLYRIAINVVNDEFRRREKTRLSVPVEDRANELKSPLPNPAEALERNQLLEAVDAALLQHDTRQASSRKIFRRR